MMPIGIKEHQRVVEELATEIRQLKHTIAMMQIRLDSERQLRESADRMVEVYRRTNQVIGETLQRVVRERNRFREMLLISGQSA